MKTAKTGLFTSGIRVVTVILAGVIISWVILAVRTDRPIMGVREAEADGQWNGSRATTQSVPLGRFDECTTSEPCVLWKRGWHAQPQRVNGVVTMVDVYDWRCIGWENTPGYYPAQEPLCRPSDQAAGR